MAAKDKELAILGQKESQLGEKVEELCKQLKDSKAEMESVMAQLNARTEESSVSTTEQQAALDSLQKSHQDERDTLITEHATQLNALQDELSTEQKKWEEESLQAKLDKAAQQK